ncbi:PGPGW domain-containing protein [Trichlorobacter ammonificans]|uniref:Tellurium resistance protein TerC n=1 Tax=Trichlorobacter ammonificans TaxID=2916410 RepID=A0ABM9D637_9BACT|nr:PGPGW domain-containing protein [Trichlorobacter ammonificans]CAH2029898.1 protein of unknown function [Trichlorobacter ammonificans]
MIQWTLKQARRLIVAVIGGTVLIAGIVMIVTPGPAVVVIPLGLGILATEFVWARHLLQRVRDHIARAAEKVKNKNGGAANPVAGTSGCTDSNPLDNGGGR